MASLDSMLGPLLGAAFANCGLYAVEVLQVGYYYLHYPKDRTYLKLAVFLAFLCDTLGTVSVCACIYMYTITYWGDPTALGQQYWPVPVFTVTTQTTGLIVQVFLIHRYIVLTKSRLIATGLALLSLAAFGGCISSAITLVLHPSFTERHLIKTAATLWIVSSTVADVIIAAALIIALQRVKPPFKSTKIMINKMINGAIQTGCSGSLVATVALILYLMDDQSTVATALFMTLGRVYTLTMLRNLNMRAAVKAAGSRGGTTIGGELSDTSIHFQLREGLKFNTMEEESRIDTKTVQEWDQTVPEP